MKVDDELLLVAYDAGDLNDEEFILLYDLNRRNNLNLPYWDYPRFVLDTWKMTNVFRSLDLKKMTFISYLKFWKYLNL